MWKMAMRAKAPRTPSERAITTGTPYLGRPYRSGAYAKEVHGDAKALCHVSDLQSQSLGQEVCFGRGKSPKASEAIYHIERSEKRWAGFVSKQKLQGSPYDIYGQHHLKCQYSWVILRKHLEEDKYGSMNAKLNRFTEILLILWNSNVIWSEAFVSQLGKKQEREKPVRRCHTPTRISWH